MEGPVPAELAAEPLGWDTFEADRLAAALFSETNRVRQEQGLRRLRSDRRLTEAADLQAGTNALLGAVSHDNPLAGRQRVQDRVRLTGVVALAVSENVASVPARDLRPGQGVRLRVEPGGAKVPLDGASGEEVPWLSYAEVARRLVEQWMESPGHRANLLQRDATHLACGAALARHPLGGEIVHGCQVFVVIRSAR